MKNELNQMRDGIDQLTDCDGHISTGEFTISSGDILETFQVYFPIGTWYPKVVDSDGKKASQYRWHSEEYWERAGKAQQLKDLRAYKARKLAGKPK